MSQRSPLKRRKAQSPYAKYGKSPFVYSRLQGLEFQRHLVRLFGVDYWVHTKPIRGRDGQRQFPDEAYNINGEQSQ